MEDTTKLEAIIEKLNKGMHFGLFDDGNKCYFQDGEHVSYTDLWKSLHMVHKLDHHHKTLPEICPDTFVGAFKYKFSRHKWKKNRS